MGPRALSSGGERFLDTEEVGGSNPPAPTSKSPAQRPNPTRRVTSRARVVNASKQRTQDGVRKWASGRWFRRASKESVRVRVGEGIYLKASGKYLATFRDTGRPKHWREYRAKAEAEA